MCATNGDVDEETVARWDGKLVQSALSAAGDVSSSGQPHESGHEDKYDEAKQSQTQFVLMSQQEESCLKGERGGNGHVEREAIDGSQSAVNGAGHVPKFPQPEEPNTLDFDSIDEELDRCMDSVLEDGEACSGNLLDDMVNMVNKDSAKCNGGSAGQDQVINGHLGECGTRINVDSTYGQQPGTGPSSCGSSEAERSNVAQARGSVDAVAINTGICDESKRRMAGDSIGRNESIDGVGYSDRCVRTGQESDSGTPVDD